MCWVMPPASPDTTLAWRSASSSEVLPWSTWPITVTTGERGSVSVESSTTSNRPSSTSDAATRLTEWPISSAISCAVSASITSVILCIAPCFISRRMTSSARRHAVGEFLDRDRFRDRALADQLFLRLVGGVALQALGAAAERGDRTLAASVGVQRGDQRQAAALLLRARLVGGLGGRDGAHGAAGAAPDLARTFVFIGTVGGNARGARGRRGCARTGCGRAGSRRGGSRCCGRRRGRGLGLGLAKSLLGLDFGLAL